VLSYPIYRTPHGNLKSNPLEAIGTHLDSYSPVCYGVFLDCNVSASWPIFGEIIFSGKANRGAFGAILWPMYIYKALPLYSGFGFTSSWPQSCFQDYFRAASLTITGMGRLSQTYPTTSKVAGFFLSWRDPQ